jgi:catechol 2,3-dioxygenase-like lactoylglutathione lyase family enzyme
VHLALIVDDLDARIRACGSFGWRVAGGSRTMLDGPHTGARFVYLHDPDGLTLERIQLPDGGGDST